MDNKAYAARNKMETELNKEMRRRSDEMMSKKDKEIQAKAKEEARRDANSLAKKGGGMMGGGSVRGYGMARGGRACKMV
jgi:hypothetical protein